jgi:hypothetical protein
MAVLAGGEGGGWGTVKLVSTTSKKSGTREINLLLFHSFVVQWGNSVICSLCLPFRSICYGKDTVFT